MNVILSYNASKWAGMVNDCRASKRAGMLSAELELVLH